MSLSATPTRPDDAYDSSVCPFCRSEQPETAFLCTNCGRMFRLETLDPSNRFWGDAFYVYRFRTITARPRLEATTDSSGLRSEEASFELGGDRYVYTTTGKGGRVKAKVRAVQTKEVEYTAKIADTHDGSGRLVKREVHGELQSKPKRFLYRLIDFRYNDGRIGGAKVRTSIYASSGDWKKKPAQWIEHFMLDVEFEYEEDVLTTVHATRRVGNRDLRGNAGYDKEKEESFTEAVQVELGLVTGFGPPQIHGEE